VGKDLTVSKTASPAFKRTYHWDISKDADKTKVEIADGGKAKFTYTVNVSETGFTDSDWAVTGKITVSNPNDWESVTGDVSDQLPDADCAVTGGSSVVVGASDSVVLDYTCTYASAPAYNTTLTNTGTATWDKAAANTPNGTASGTATLEFSTPTT